MWCVGTQIIALLSTTQKHAQMTDDFLGGTHCFTRTVVPGQKIKKSAEYKHTHTVVSIHNKPHSYTRELPE